MIEVGDRVVLNGEHSGIITNVLSDREGRPQTALVFLTDPMDGRGWARLDVSSAFLADAYLLN
ncbi:MAG TPA: hypothetical protein VK735_40190 [Pseudonocardia sp.]|uniref:hypothetical protein n=1 Tax=Pseudonocardia sp. TaxID=60912 RepID=UPI002C2E9093|nr:hypothetical protein [Pseudonocardia sp.]HTF53706.1 hypothetical protein [Pseudonocardia sp.]